MPEAWAKLTAVTEYEVRIDYREPSYELRVGKKEDPYFWVYRVAAPSEDEAKRQALERFREFEAASGVGWVRVVLQVQAIPAG